MPEDADERLRPGMRIDVETFADHPTRVTLGGAPVDVADVLDAWRAAGRWWRGEPPADVFRVELQDGRHLVLAQQAGRWRIEAIDD